MRVVKAGRLTATSYAILGVLTQRDCSPYELNKEIQDSLGQVWPRSERKIYDEVKCLEQLGLAQATISYNGQRRRTTYAITGTGRETLDDWLDLPVQRGTVLESEALLRIYLFSGDHPERMQAALSAIEADADAIIANALSIDAHELEEEADASETLIRWRAHSHEFLGSYAAMLKSWVRETRDLLDRWQDADTETIREAALERVLDAQKDAATGDVTSS